MKKYNFKKLIYSLILLMALNSYCLSQRVTFSAKYIKSGNPVKLDSIKIINLTQNKDTMIKNSNSFDLTIFTIVSNESTITNSLLLASENYPNPFEDLTKFEMSVPQENNIKVSVFNNYGSMLLSYSELLKIGNYLITFDAANLSTGLYFVNINYLNENQLFKVIKNGTNISNEQYGKITIENNDILNQSLHAYKNNPSIYAVTPGDKYNFIGYAAGYKPDTLFNQVPVVGDSFMFELKSAISPWYFSKGTADIYFEKCYRVTLYQSSSSGYSSERDTSSFNLSINTSEPMKGSYFSCANSFNGNDISLCKLSSGNSYPYHEVGWQITFQIDSLSYKLINISIYRCNDIRSGNNWGDRYGQETYKLEIDSISYQTDSKGIISANINGQEISKVLKNLEYENWSDRVGGGVSVVDVVITRVTDYGNNSFIKIVLYP